MLKTHRGAAQAIVEAWERDYLHESMVDTLVGGDRTPFERVRRVTLSQLLSKLKIEHTQDEIEAVLSRAVPTLFPDVIESLVRLGEKYTLAVLSNGDLASLERVVAFSQFWWSALFPPNRPGTISSILRSIATGPGSWSCIATRFCMWRHTVGIFEAPKPSECWRPTSTVTVFLIRWAARNSPTWKLPI